MTHNFEEPSISPGAVSDDNLAEDERYQTRFAASLQAKAGAPKQLDFSRGAQILGYIIYQCPKMLGGHQNTHHQEKMIKIWETQEVFQPRPT